MALSVVQTGVKGHATGFNNSVATAAFGSSTTTGNTIVVVVTADAGTQDITSVTDTQGNSYSRITGASSYNSTGSCGAEIWYARNITGSASNVVTAHDSGFLVGCVFAYEIGGLPTTGTIIDIVGTGTGSNGTETTGNMVTTNANDIIIAGSVMSSVAANTWTAGTSFLNLLQDVGSGSGLNSAAETRIVSSTGTYTGNFTSTIINQSTATVAVALSDTAISSGPTPAYDPAMYLSRNRFQANNLKPLITDY